MTGSKLKIDIRRKSILEHLRQEGMVSVMTLSEQLQVTPVTIRNDLAILEQEGCLLRVQGGAVQVPNAAKEYPAMQLDSCEAQKRIIADAVARMIRDGDTLFLNSGTTCECIAAALSIRRNLNVVTNSLRVATLLGEIPSFRVVLIGGQINARYGFTYGGDAQEQLSAYQADWAILSVDGVSAQGGITTHHAEEAIVDRLMAAGARRVLIAADDSKIGRTGFSRVCGCDGNLSLVTNENSDPLAISALQSSGVNITLVK